MEKKACIIFDFVDKRLNNGKLFDFEFVKNISHTYVPILDLIKKLKEANIDVITPDQWSENIYDIKKSFLISALFGEESSKLIKKGVFPLLLMCQESPAIASKFYFDFNKISSYYKYSAVFEGMKKKLSKNNTSLDIYFPTKKLGNSIETSFEKKKLLVLIAANKNVPIFISNIKRVFLSLIYRLNIKFLYRKRLQFLKFFTKNYPNDINVYGNGWTKKEIYNIEKVYMGKAEDKEKVISNYKFCLCFENAVFPGYITEKIFDVMFSNSVPVYCGAKDIVNFIPENCFINLNDFNNVEELYEFLTNMNELTYNEYLFQINNYLLSDKYKHFSSDYFVETVFSMLNRELIKNNE